MHIGSGIPITGSDVGNRTSGKPRPAGDLRALPVDAGPPPGKKPTGPGNKDFGQGRGQSRGRGQGQGGGQSSGLQPAFSNVVLLADMNGTDEDTTYSGLVGSVQNTSLAFTGSCKLDSAQVKFGATSMFFDGTGDCVYQNTVDVDHDINTQDFCIEAWIRATNWGSSKLHMIASRWKTGSGEREWRILIEDTGEIKLLVSSDGTGNTACNGSIQTVNVDQWYHVAGTREGTTLRVFLDGVETGTAELSADFDINNNAPPAFIIGGSQNPLGPSSPFGAGNTGWIDDVRFVVGEALYTANFTPPTAAHPKS